MSATDVRQRDTNSNHILMNSRKNNKINILRLLQLKADNFATSSKIRQNQFHFPILTSLVKFCSIRYFLDGFITILIS